MGDFPINWLLEHAEFSCDKPCRCEHIIFSFKKMSLNNDSYGLLLVKSSDRNKILHIFRNLKFHMNPIAICAIIDKHKDIKTWWGSLAMVWELSMFERGNSTALGPEDAERWNRRMRNILFWRHFIRYILEAETFWKAENKYRRHGLCIITLQSVSVVENKFGKRDKNLIFVVCVLIHK